MILHYLKVQQGEGEATQHALRAFTDREISQDPAHHLLLMARSIDRFLLDTFGQVLADREWSVYSREWDGRGDTIYGE